MDFEYKPSGICSSKITFHLDGDVVTDIHFTNGCDGNLKALSRIVDGMTVSEIQQKLRGITCDRKSTSCSDQLARAVEQAFAKATVKEKDNKETTGTL